MSTRFPQLETLNGQPRREAKKPDRLAEATEKDRDLDRKDAEWARQVKTRDHWTCQMCGRKVEQTIAFVPSRAEAHHIFAKGAHPELRHELDVGVTLCLRDHRRAQKDRSLLPLSVIGRAELAYRRIVLGEANPERPLL